MGSGARQVLQTQFYRKRSCDHSSLSAPPVQSQGQRHCGTELLRIRHGASGLNGQVRFQCLPRKLHWICWVPLLVVMSEAAPLNFIREADVMEVAPMLPRRWSLRLCAHQIVHKAKALSWICKRVHGERRILAGGEKRPPVTMTTLTTSRRICQSHYGSASVCPTRAVLGLSSPGVGRGCWANFSPT
mmetsp:Transcript_21597/g.55277  ORF Transcript_21597/g.55277 Transcript_21597/m.55277 type:complete len:187 (+) Transcript_21597:196-756(+)